MGITPQQEFLETERLKARCLHRGQVEADISACARAWKGMRRFADAIGLGKSTVQNARDGHACIGEPLLRALYGPRGRRLVMRSPTGGQIIGAEMPSGVHPVAAAPEDDDDDVATILDIVRAARFVDKEHSGPSEAEAATLSASADTPESAGGILSSCCPPAPAAAVEDGAAAAPFVSASDPLGQADASSDPPDGRVEVAPGPAVGEGAAGHHAQESDMDRREAAALAAIAGVAARTAEYVVDEQPQAEWWRRLPHGPPRALLLAWRDKYTADIVAAQEARRDVQARLIAAERRVDALEQLLAVMEDGHG